MTITEILEQAKVLSVHERKELVKLLVDTLDNSQQTEPMQQEAHWGESLNQLLDEVGPIELVDSHIEDPVEWVKAQRRKRDEQLKPYWDGEQ